MVCTIWYDWFKQSTIDHLEHGKLDPHKKQACHVTKLKISHHIAQRHGKFVHYKRKVDFTCEKNTWPCSNSTKLFEHFLCISYPLGVRMIHHGPKWMLS
jgi:hypothetical protein